MFQSRLAILKDPQSEVEDLNMKTTQPDNWAFAAWLTLFLVSSVPAWAQTQLIQDPGFETVGAPWDTQNSTAGWWNLDNSAGAHSGNRYEYLGVGSDGVTTANNVEDVLYQDVTVPSGTTSLAFTFWLKITSDDTSGIAHDTLAVEVRNTGNAGLQTVAYYSNADANNAWVQQSFTITGYAGQAIRVAFHGKTDASIKTVFRVDDVSLLATTAQPVLSVSPAAPSTQPGSAGSLSLNVNNTGGGTMSYSASVTSGSSWLTIASGGSGGNSGSIVLSYSANNTGLQRAGTVTVTASGASGSPVNVTITQAPAATQPVLSVTPASPPTQPATAGSLNLSVNNTGSGSMTYSATVTSGSSWLSISSGGAGGNSGTIVASYSANNTASLRSGTIQVTAAGASGSPVALTIAQAAGSGTTSVLGADFNADAGTISWQQETAGSRSFLFIKAAQGNNVNSFLPSNMSGAPAVSASFTFGVFDYADPDEYANASTRVSDPSNSSMVAADAQAAAKAFYQIAGPYLTAGHLVPALDLEDEEGFGGFNSPYASVSGYPKWTWSEIAEWIAAWTTQLQQEDTSLDAPILYMTQGYAQNISPQLINGFLPSPISYPLWIADISDSPNIDPSPSIGSWATWVIEQYSYRINASRRSGCAEFLHHAQFSGNSNERKSHARISVPRHRRRN